MNLAGKKNVPIVPIDSEHSAIWQCLTGENKNIIRRLILTASGGPFRTKSKNELAKVTVEEALKHPNWDMGPKITIDSATLMNKGLEVIEAFWLYGVNQKSQESLPEREVAAPIPCDGVLGFGKQIAGGGIA